MNNDNDTPTPGQVAFAAFWPAYDAVEGPPKGPCAPWETLSPAEHAAWEAAAQAVLEAAAHHPLPAGEGKEAPHA